MIYFVSINIYNSYSKLHNGVFLVCWKISHYLSTMFLLKNDLVERILRLIIMDEENYIKVHINWTIIITRIYNLILLFWVAYCSLLIIRYNCIKNNYKYRRMCLLFLLIYNVILEYNLMLYNWN